MGDLRTADDGEDRFWRVVLRCGVNGCIQSMLDEYAHVLRDHLGLVGEASDDKVHQIAEQMHQALSLRAANLTVRDRHASAGGVQSRKARFLGSAATSPFASAISTSDSAFWPFVLATTSVGQEGLDFHP